MAVPQKTEVVPYSNRTYLKATYLEREHTIEHYSEWELSAKVDGVRLILDSTTGKVTTRNGEDVLPHIADAVRQSPYNDVELFAGNWSDSISVLRGTKPFNASMLYGLNPTVDPRLYMGKSKMTYEYAMQIMQTLVDRGIEGLIMRCGSIWMKVVPVHTADVLVIGMKEGNGRKAGTCGALVTNYGNVGSGLSDEMSAALWAQKDRLINRLIVEVEYRERHASGKFRFARFVRPRLDKTTESING